MFVMFPFLLFSDSLLKLRTWVWLGFTLKDEITCYLSFLDPAPFPGNESPTAALTLRLSSTGVTTMSLIVIFGRSEPFLTSAGCLAVFFLISSPLISIEAATAGIDCFYSLSSMHCSLSLKKLVYGLTKSAFAFTAFFWVIFVYGTLLPSLCTAEFFNRFASLLAFKSWNGTASLFVCFSNLRLDIFGDVGLFFAGVISVSFKILAGISSTTVSDRFSYLSASSSLRLAFCRSAAFCILSLSFCSSSF